MDDIFLSALLRAIIVTTCVAIGLSQRESIVGQKLFLLLSKNGNDP
jgi:hypothetical protein